MSQDPYTPIVHDGLDVRLIARRQRRLIWLVLASVASMAISCLGSPVALMRSGAAAMILVAVIDVGLRLAAWVGTILLMRALRTNLVVLIICAVLMLIPFINLLILLMENLRATRTLRRAGLRVGFMGVKDQDVIIRLAPHVCRTCGYDLTGNVSGRCPECGAVVADPQAVVLSDVLGAAFPPPAGVRD